MLSKSGSEINLNDLTLESDDTNENDVTFTEPQKSILRLESERQESECL